MAVVRPPLPPGPFLVVGLARSGVAAAIALRATGATVSGCDSGAVGEDGRAAMAAAGVPVHERTDGVALLEGVATLVKSPGVPQEAPVVQAARARGIRVVGELEVGWRLVPNEVVAITGSNGKTTTTELVGAIHRAAGLPVAVAGNVGTALSSLAGTLSPETVVVCECSSFQLEDTEAFAPEAAVLLNLAPDHLDRHGTFEAYRAAKLLLFARQDPSAIAVLPVGLEAGGAARRVRFAPLGPVESSRAPAAESVGAASAESSRAAAAESVGAAAAESSRAAAAESARADMELRDGALSWRGTSVIPVSELRLRGVHNVENAMAAGAVTLARGVDPEAVRTALRTFAGVAHRLEEVATVGGVLFVDDSKATNVASAVVGLRSFEGGVHAILGGRGKGRTMARSPRPSPTAAAPSISSARRPRRSVSRWTTAACRCATAARSAAPWRRRARPRRPARSSCSHRPVRPMTSTAPSRSGEHFRALLAS
jgi:UDP-N-acetylmuramoylalanine--D-glutamate ligase